MPIKCGVLARTFNDLGIDAWIIAPIVFLSQIGNYENKTISQLVPLDDLDVDDEVKQLFIDVFRKDHSSRPTAFDLLQRPVIRSATDYAQYFDDVYDSEDSEEIESAPLISYVQMESNVQEISLVSSNSHSSMTSLGDKVPDLPHFSENQNMKRGRGASQDSGVSGDLENSLNGSSVYGAQLSMRSSSSGSCGQQRLVHQDSGVEDVVAMQDCSQADRPG